MKTKFWFALVAVYIIWGSTYLAILYMVESIPPFLAAGIRFMISGLILYIWRKRKGDRTPNKRQWKAAAMIGLFLLVGGNGSLVWAQQYIPSGVASLFLATVPLWMVLLDTLRPGGKNPGKLIWLGVLLGFSGIVLLVAPWQSNLFRAENLNPYGVAALLLSALSWSTGSLYSRKVYLPDSPLLYSGMEMLAGCLGLFILSGLTGEWSRLDISTIQPHSFWGLVYLVVFGSLVGFVSYTWLLRNAPTPLVATYAYVNPLVAILLGVLFANEILDGQVMISATVIISSVILINSANNTARRMGKLTEVAIEND